MPLHRNSLHRPSWSATSQWSIAANTSWAFSWKWIFYLQITVTRFNHTEMVRDAEQTPIQRDVCRVIKSLHLWIKAALLAQGMYHSSEKGTMHRGKDYQWQSRDSNQAPTRSWCITNQIQWRFPDSKVHGANIGPIWGRQDPGGPYVGPINLDIWVHLIIHEWIHKLHIALQEANINILAAMLSEINLKKVTYLKLFETNIYSNCHNFRQCFDNIFLVANIVLEISKYIDWIYSSS